MCLAIGPVNPASRGRLASAWWQVAAHPHRLFIFSALVHGAIMNLILVYQEPGFVCYELIMFVLYGVVAALFLGFLLRDWPEWNRTSAISYPAYGAVYNLNFIALLLIELGFVLWPSVLLLGGLMMCVAWLLALRALLWSHKWRLGKHSWLNMLLMLSLYALIVALSINVYFVFNKPDASIYPWLFFKDLLIVLVFAGSYIALSFATKSTNR